MASEPVYSDPLDALEEEDEGTSQIYETLDEEDERRIESDHESSEEEDGDYDELADPVQVSSSLSLLNCTTTSLNSGGGDVDNTTTGSSFDCDGSSSLHRPASTDNVSNAKEVRCC